MTKQEFLDYFSLIDYAYNESGRLESLSRMLDELLKEQQEEQEALVRCKDCKYGYCLNPNCDTDNRYYQCLATYCGGMRISHKSDWFCADGKRR